MKHTAFALALFSPLAIGAPEYSSAQSYDDESRCEFIDQIGRIYADELNPYIQLLNINGSLQYQMMHTEGTGTDGNDFSDRADEYRRARLGTEVKFLQYFTANTSVNLVGDDRFNAGSLDWGDQEFDIATFIFDIKKAFLEDSLDIFNLTFGRHKLEMSAEAAQSANDILTIERSPISNKVYDDARVTGLSLQTGKNHWLITTGVFSTEADAEFINGGFNEGISYYGAVDFTGMDQFNFRWDIVMNDVKTSDENTLGYAWATTFNATYENDLFGILGTLALGDNGDQLINSQEGNFHGLTIMPWYWIVEEKLQGVFQYGFSESSQSEGIRTNRRYIRDLPTGGLVGDGYGDALHTFYAGFNYYICSENLKVMGGAEYTSLNANLGDVSALTYLFGVRMKF